MTIRVCSCGSGRERYKLTDGHGIFMTYVCEKCEREKLKEFRPDIFTEYECDEPIEPEC